MNERELIIDAVRRSGLSVIEAWIQYFALGGSLSELEVEAYLLGEGDLAPFERTILAEAMREALSPVSPRADRRTDGGTPDYLRPLGAAGSVFLGA